MSNAMDRIRDEMAKEPDDGAAQYIGEYLTDYLRKHPGAEPRLADEKKSIRGALDKMRDYASKHKHGGVAVVDPDTGLKIILEYYGLGDSPEKPKSADACGFGLDLDDLL